MAYCTSTDIAKALPERTIIQLTDDEKLAAVNDSLATAEGKNAAITTRLTEVIAKADTMIDSYCRKRFLPPITDSGGNTPATVRMLSVDLAIYQLHARRLSDFGVPEAVETNHKDAMAMLKAIAKGDIDLGVDPAPAASSAAVAQASSTPTTRLFTDDTLDGF